MPGYPPVSSGKNLRVSDWTDGWQHNPRKMIRGEAEDVTADNLRGSRCRSQELIDITFINQGHPGIDEGRNRRQCIRPPVSTQGL